MVAFSHTFFGLAHHTICTYYTMIFGLAPYDFFAEGETQKAHSPALSVGGVGPAKKLPQNPLYRVFGEPLRPNSAEVGNMQ